MSNFITINDTCKEVYTVLSLFEDELIEKIPSNVLRKIIELAADSEKEFHLDAEKKLEEQEISDASKDLIALIYYNYLTSDENEKNELSKKWQENDNKYQIELEKKYSLDSLFKQNNETINEILPIAVEEKESFFMRIINKIKKFLKKA